MFLPLYPPRVNSYFACALCFSSVALTASCPPIYVHICLLSNDFFQFTTISYHLLDRTIDQYSFCPLIQWQEYLSTIIFHGRKLKNQIEMWPRLKQWKNAHVFDIRRKKIIYWCIIHTYSKWQDRIWWTNTKLTKSTYNIKSTALYNS